LDKQFDDFAMALQSFQMISSSRIIVILSRCKQTDGAIDRLTAIGVMNIVTADTPEVVSEELSECLSDEGMREYIPQLGSAGPKEQSRPKLSKNLSRRKLYNTDGRREISK